MFSPSPAHRTQSPFDSQSQGQSQGSFGSLNSSRRRPRPAHQSQPSLNASLEAHPPKRPRQRSVSSQRQLNASPEAQAVVLASGSESIKSQNSSSGQRTSLREWTKNEKYCVSQLTALPLELRDRGDISVQDLVAVTEQTTGTALLITRVGAYVWKYDDPHPLPKPDHFPLPRDEQPGNDGIIPLAIGSLVSPSASSDEPGLVAVMPVSGRIAYWDAVGSAIAEGLFARRRGVEGRVQLVANETVDTICSVEPAGYVLAMSTGRLAHLSLRDAMGKPNIQVNTMRNFGGNVVTGLLGGIASALKAGTMRRDVAAVRPGRVISGTGRELLVCSTKGQLTVWEINKGGATAVVADVDMKDQLINRIRETGPQWLDSMDNDHFTVLDCILTSPRKTTAAEILILAAFEDPARSDLSTHYALVMVSVTSSKSRIKSIHPISCYRTSIASSSTSVRPRLYLPNPHRTAFIVFSKSVVVVSVIPEDKYDHNDESETMDDDYDPRKGFEDVIDFKPEANVEIIGGGYEDITHDINPKDITNRFAIDSGKDTRKRFYSPSIIIATKGAGVLRCSLFDAEPTNLRPKPSLKPVPVKMKLEQAVFYGQDEKTEVHYPIEEVQSAAREVSKEILSSRTRYLPSILPSVENHLSIRAQKLHALADHLKRNFPPLNRETKWKLCWDAEKLAAALSIYIAYDERMRSGDERFQGLLKDAIVSHLTTHNAVNEHVDPLRDWFAQHVLSLWELLPYAKVAYEQTKQRDPTAIAGRIEEANEMLLSSLTTAFHFRINNAMLYGLEDQIDDRGIPDFSGLATAPWTSGPDILTILGRMIEITNKLLDSLTGINEQNKPFETGIIDQLVELVETTCRNFVERSTWCQRQSDPRSLKLGEEIQERYLRSRNGWIKSLDKRDRSDRAVEIAEKYQDFRTLVELTFEELVKIDVYYEQHAAEKAAEVQRSTVLNRLQEYFQRFGKEFAFTLYDYQIEQENLRELLLQFPNFKHYLTEFLRSSPKYAKLSWINDVGRTDFKTAGKVLVEVADAENDLWCKTVELSIGKLALLVGQQDDSLERFNNTFDAKIKLVDDQNLFYGYLYQELRGALDLQAGVEIGMSAWADNVSMSQSMREQFKKGLTRVVSRQSVDVETFIDILTLKNSDDDSYLAGAPEGWPGEFCLALEALSLSSLDNERRAIAEKTIWRRCYLRDDWVNIVRTENKSDEDVQEQSTSTALFGLLRFGIKRGLFDSSTQLHPFSPTASLHNQPKELLLSRFPDATPKQIGELHSDLEVENAKLRGVIGKTKLDSWFEGLVLEAKRWCDEEEAQHAEEAMHSNRNSAHIQALPPPSLPIGGSYVDVDDMMDTD